MTHKLRRIRLINDAPEELTLSDFRKEPGEIIRAVELGKTFTLTKQGRPVAVLSPVELNALQLGAALRKLK